MRITLLWPGKTRQAWLQDGISTYLRKLGYYYQVRIVETRAKGGTRGRRARAASKSGNMKAAMEEEGRLLLKSVPKGAMLVALDVKGKALSSEGLAQFLRRQADAGTREICFAIGGAYGLSGQVLDAAHLRLSLSTMTFTHDMARLILAEQLYRAATINAGEPYHH